LTCYRGTAIAKIVAENTAAHPDIFEPEVQMWVFEEQIEIPKDSKQYRADSPLCQGKQKLSELINELHENVKYLPDIRLPSNLKANPDVRAAAKDSTILVFNLPHQFIAKTCSDLVGFVLPYSRGVSCIKGVSVADNNISLFSDVIGQKLGIYCGALSGANIATEVALEKFCETTVAYDPPSMDSRGPTPNQSSPDLPQLATTNFDAAKNSSSQPKGQQPRLQPLPDSYPALDHATLHTLFHRPYFHVRLTNDVTAVSLCGALKNIVALAAGFVSGLQWGDNAKAAIMRVGLLEMTRFGHTFFADRGIRTATFTEESAGVADLITSCSGGRNYRCAKMATERGVRVQEVERTELNGQILQGIGTAEEVHGFLKSRGKAGDFPLFTAVYRESWKRVIWSSRPVLIVSQRSCMARRSPRICLS